MVVSKHIFDQIRLWRNTGFVLAAFFAASLGPASANVIYDWVPLSQSGLPGLLSIGELVFTDAVVNSGSFAADDFCLSGCPLPNGLVSAHGPLGSIGPVILVDMAVTFDSDGTLSGMTDYNDFGADFFVSGIESDWSGAMNSDSLNCSNPAPCHVTGYWRAVPEPSSLALLGSVIIVFALLGFAWLLRRKSITVMIR